MEQRAGLYGSVIGHCRRVANYALVAAQNKEAMTNFYDLGIPGVGNLTVNQVTLNQANSIQRFGDAIGFANAFTTFPFGYYAQTAIIFKAGELYQTDLTPCLTCHTFIPGYPLPGSAPKQYEEFIVMHELLLNAYANFSDYALYTNSVNVANKLKFPQGPPNNWTAATAPTTYISDWMSTDCTCTPGVDNNCLKNTAKW